MSRLAIILCLIPRVISGSYTTVQHETYSEHISRQSRSNLPTQDDYVYRQFGKPGVRTAIEQPTVDPYIVNDHFGAISFGQGASDSQTPYQDLISPYTTPSTFRSKLDYALSKSVSDAGYESSKSRASSMLDKLKSMMHYHPPPEIANSMVGYDGTNDYHMDDDDVRSSRSLYDNWPYFYHSPYEYEHNKDISDTEKAKDKRYVEDRAGVIIPVNEIIENDYPQTYERTAKYTTRDVTDNPIKGNGPFFSFVLNDYFDRNGDEDPVIFKGLDFGNDFDHDTYVPITDENRVSRRIESNYFTTVSPVTVYRDHGYKRTSDLESAKDRNRKREHTFDKSENGAKKNSEHNTGYENHSNRYNGMKDFLDNFANKFGSENFQKKMNIIKATNEDKGENKKGFRRVYHKDEYQEDNEFYDNKNSSSKGLEKGGYDKHVGGSEAYLRSQAAAAVGNESQAASNAGNTSDAKFENSHNGHDKVNTVENKLDRYRHVAKEAAKKNSADYVDTYRDLYGK